MANALLDRVLREGGGADLLETLAERLTPTDLQSLLLEVYRRRAARRSAAVLLARYADDRFVRPSAISPQTFLEFDRLAFSHAAPAFELVELAPVCPLGAVSVVASVDQNNAVATSRNTEVVSDSTNVLALECAVRRRALRRSRSGRDGQVRLCASHRLLRPQKSDKPGMLAHFRLFALCTAGRDEGSRGFEKQTLSEHLVFYLRLLSALNGAGYALRAARVALTDFAADAHGGELLSGVGAALAAAFPGVRIASDPARPTGRGYYDAVCFHIYVTDAAGNEHLIADGGLTTWTQQLLSDKKERLFLSGIGTERVCGLLGTDET